MIEKHPEVSFLSKEITAGLNWLRFPPEIEKEFLKFYFQNIKGHLRAASLAGAIMYLLFGIHDAIVYPEYRQTLWMVRYLMAGPYLLAFLLYLFLGSSEKAKHILASLSVLVVGGAITLDIFITQDPRQFYYTGLVLVIMFAYAVSGLRLKYAFYPSVGLIFLFLFIAIHSTVLESDVVKNDIFGLISTNSMGMIAGYLLERFRRKEFIYLMQISRDMAALKEANEKLHHLSYYDSLTGIHNRRAFERHLNTEWQRAVRYSYPLSLLIIDIDDFKIFNDTYGHIAGDEALKRVASAISTVVNRSGDMVARYGGEEFAVLMIGTSEEGARQIAGDILSRIRELRIQHSGTKEGIMTVSIGGATIRPTLKSSLETFFTRADKALYSAKTRGKNTHCHITIEPN